MKKCLLLFVMTAFLVMPSFGQKRKTYKKSNRTTQLRNAASYAKNAVMGIGLGLETYRASFGTYGGWITFISRYAPKAGSSTSLGGELLETKKEIRRLDEGNVEAGKRFITNLVKYCGIKSALNQIYTLWEFTTPEWNWIEKVAYNYQRQLDKENNDED